MATATVLGITGLAVPAYADGDAPKTDGAPSKLFELKDATLEWGVKESFREYVVNGYADGKIKMAGGAKQAPKNGAFTFGEGAGTYDLDTHAVTTTFKGGVRFLGHADDDGKWELNLKLDDLKLKTDAKSDGKTGTVTADITSQDGPVQQDIEIATLDLAGVKASAGAGGTMTFPKIPAKLTEAGAKAFSYKEKAFYKAGAELDPVTLTAKQGGEAKPPEQGGRTAGGQAGGASGGGASTGTSGGGTTAGSTGGTSTGTTTGTSSGSTGDTSGTGSRKPKGELYDGNLDWGLRKSFRDYITDGFGKGKIEVTGPATKTGAGFRFPKGEGKFDEAASTLKATFAGEVRFTGHEGKLDLTFSKFALEVSGKSGKLSAEVLSKEAGSTPKTVQLADLAVPDGALKAKDGVVYLQGLGAKLTEAGVDVFSHEKKPFYKKGADLDPVTVAVATEANAKLPEPPAGTGTGTGTSGTTGSTGSGTTATNTANTTGGGAATTGGTGGTDTTTPLASTGASTPTGPLLGAAGALVLAGGGAVFATRRRGRGPAQG
ncbi:HtaA domain-containing protein [Streptomyces klenkii]